jgi:hypothetical protein
VIKLVDCAAQCAHRRRADACEAHPHTRQRNHGGQGGACQDDRVRDRIETGAKFEDQAKLNSEDATSAKGGDLGWVNPGDTVPEFEQAMNKLAVGQLSEPIRTTFGWHIIVVDGRRTQDITADRRREVARNASAAQVRRGVHRVRAAIARQGLRRIQDRRKVSARRAKGPSALSANRACFP